MHSFEIRIRFVGVPPRNCLQGQHETNFQQKVWMPLKSVARSRTALVHCCTLSLCYLDAETNLALSIPSRCRATWVFVCWLQHSSINVRLVETLYILLADSGSTLVLIRSVTSIEWLAHLQSIRLAYCCIASISNPGYVAPHPFKSPLAPHPLISPLAPQSPPTFQTP